MSPLKEIKPREVTSELIGYDKVEKKCPSCKSHLYHGRVPCPDGKSGCCVLHYGYRCFTCNKIFKEV